MISKRSPVSSCIRIAMLCKSLAFWARWTYPSTHTPNISLRSEYNALQKHFEMVTPRFRFRYISHCHLFAHNLHVLSQSGFEKKMKRNLNRGVTISKCFCRALYSDLSEMIGVCVEGYVHLAQNASDLAKITMRMRGETNECF